MTDLLDSNLCEQLRGIFFSLFLLFIFGWFIESNKNLIFIYFFVYR